MTAAARRPSALLVPASSVPSSARVLAEPGRLVLRDDGGHEEVLSAGSGCQVVALGHRRADYPDLGSLHALGPDGTALVHGQLLRWVPTPLTLLGAVDHDRLHADPATYTGVQDLALVLGVPLLRDVGHPGPTSRELVPGSVPALRAPLGAFLLLGLGGGLLWVLGLVLAVVLQSSAPLVLMVVAAAATLVLLLGLRFLDWRAAGTGNGVPQVPPVLRPHPRAAVSRGFMRWARLGLCDDELVVVDGNGKQLRLPGPGHVNGIVAVNLVMNAEESLDRLELCDSRDTAWCLLPMAAWCGTGAGRRALERWCEEAGLLLQQRASAVRDPGIELEGRFAGRTSLLVERELSGASTVSDSLRLAVVPLGTLLFSRNDFASVGPFSAGPLDTNVGQVVAALGLLLSLGWACATIAHEAFMSSSVRPA